MNTAQARSRNIEFCRFNERYPFRLAELIPIGRQDFCGSVANTFYYYETSICVSIGAAPLPTVMRHNNGCISFETAKDQKIPAMMGDCLIISFRDHTDYVPNYKMPEVTQFQLLFCLGMFDTNEDPYTIPTFINKNPYGAANTTYYYRPLKDCRFAEKDLRRTFIDGTMSLNDIWEKENGEH